MPKRVSCSLLAAILLGACASPPPNTPPPTPTPEEIRANKAPNDICYNQCLSGGGAGGATQADRDFCKQRCTW